MEGDRTAHRATTSLSQRAEFAVVVGAAFGLLIAVSAVNTIHPSAPLDEERLRLLLVFEIIVGAALLAFLHVRGWTAPSVGFQPTFQDTIVGLGLALATLLSVSILLSVTVRLFPGAPLGPQGGVFGQLGFGTVVAVSIVNPAFEELFVTAYVVTSLTNQGVNRGTAVTVSVVIRLLYHLYLGAVLAALLLIPMGLIFGYYFARRRRLWPIVVAHAATDFLALGGFT